MEAAFQLTDGDDFDENGQLSFADLTMDDSLTPLERLTQYCSSTFAVQRIALAHDIAHTARETLAGNCSDLDPPTAVTEKLLPVLQSFSTDEEEGVRQALAEQLVPLAKILPPPLYPSLTTMLLPFAFQLVTDQSNAVADAGVDAILGLTELLHEEDIDDALETLMDMSEPSRSESTRMRAAQLLCELAPVFGKDRCIDRVVPRVTELCDDDSHFSIKRVISKSLPKLSHVLVQKVIVEGQEADEDDEDDYDAHGLEVVQQEILPLFERLCSDDIWGVRSACADSIAPFSESLPLVKLRNERLVPIMMRFLNDNSRWVRNAAFQNLGRLIATLDPFQCPDDLVRAFTSMVLGGAPSLSTNYTNAKGMATNGPSTGAGSHSSGTVEDAETVEWCAFSFPAVSYTVGPDRWAELLLPAFEQLCACEDVKVRKALAYAMGDMAWVLGPTLASEHLVAAFEKFLSDVEDVRIGAVSCSASFILRLDSSSYPTLLKLLTAVPSATQNWRIRGEIAEQLSVLVDPLSRSNVRKNKKRQESDSITDWFLITSLHGTPTAVTSSGDAREIVAESAGRNLRHLFLESLHSKHESASVHVQTLAEVSRKVIRTELDHGLPVEYVANFIVPCVSVLLGDEVAAVRDGACAAVGSIVARGDSSASKDLVEGIVAHGGSHDKIVTVKCVASLLEDALLPFPVLEDGRVGYRVSDKELQMSVRAHWLPRIKLLAKDRIPNVRLMIARILRELVLANFEELSSVRKWVVDDLRDVIGTLAGDSDKEVKEEIAELASRLGSAAVGGRRK